MKLVKRAIGVKLGIKFSKNLILGTQIIYAKKGTSRIHINTTLS